MIENYSSLLPERFTRNIRGLHAERGERWLKDLPVFLTEIAERWNLQIEKPFQNLSFHYVAPCLCSDGTQAVLKIGFPEENSITRSEAQTLKFLAGTGAVKLLKFDEKLCALLLERLLPGENLVQICKIDDERATGIAINVMKKFNRSPPQKEIFPALRKWTEGLSWARNTEFPQNIFRKAKNYFDELIASSKQNLLLHGDLHHENILSAAGETFLAIDPKGIIGDIGYEISVFLNNPRSWILNHPNRRAVLKNRIAMFSQSFEIEPETLRKWAYAEAVLSAWWTFEDNGEGWQKWLAFAEVWENIET